MRTRDPLSINLFDQIIYMSKLNQISLQTNNENPTGFGFNRLLPEIRLKQGKKPLNKTQLDKLAQLSNFNNSDVIKEVTNYVTRKKLYKAGSQKYITNSIVAPLLYLENRSELHNQYQSAFYCGNDIEIIDNKIKVKRCGTRACTHCNAERTGILINQYQEIIDSWKNRHFVTLTVPNMDSNLLKGSMNEMIKITRRIQKNYTNKYGNNLEGIRKLEVTYNRHSDTYHPHLHFIVKNEEQAYYLRDQWMKLITKYNRKKDNYILCDVDIQAQDVRKCDSKSTLELFKYFTKFWETNKKKDSIKTYTPEVIDIILTSLRGRRLVQSTGFTKAEYVKPVEDYKEHLKEYYNDLADEVVNRLMEQHQTEASEKKYDPVMDGLYKYNNFLGDWEEFETGALLTYYKKPKNRKDWFAQNINFEPQESGITKEFQRKKEHIIEMFDLEREENKYDRYLEKAKENKYINSLNRISSGELQNILDKNFGTNSSVRNGGGADVDGFRADNGEPREIGFRSGWSSRTSENNQTEQISLFGDWFKIHLRS